MVSASENLDWPPIDKVDRELAKLEREAPDDLASVFWREFDSDKTSAGNEPAPKPVARESKPVQTDTIPQPPPAPPTTYTFQSPPSQSPRRARPSGKLVAGALGAIALLIILLVEAVYLSPEISRTVLPETPTAMLSTDRAEPPTVGEPAPTSDESSSNDMQVADLQEPATASNVQIASTPLLPASPVDIPALNTPLFEGTPLGERTSLPAMPALRLFNVGNEQPPSETKLETTVTLADSAPVAMAADSVPEPAPNSPINEKLAGGPGSTSDEAQTLEFADVSGAVLVESEPPEIVVAPSSGLAVTQMILTRGIADREPMDDATSFSASDNEVYAFARFINSGAPAEVAFNWYDEDSLVGTASLTIGQSDAWRTWSKSLIHTGTWRVEIIDASGTVLARTSFVVR